MKKILITTSSFGRECTEPLKMIRAAGFDYVLNPHQRKLTEDELIQLLLEHTPKYHIAGTETIGHMAIEAARPFLKLISRCGIDINNIDLEAAQEAGIKITNTPEAPTRAVAELTIGVMLDLLRGISYCDRNVRRGEFKKPMGNLLFGKTVGIIGCGRIGTAVTEILTVFGAVVIGYDKYAQENETIKLVSFDELIEISDIISLHLPFIEDNRHFINAQTMNTMKDGVIILNISRGGLIDEGALYEAVKSGKVKGAGLDCFENEPYKGALTELDNVVLTAHIGSYALETRIEQEISAVKNVLEYDNG